MLVVIGMRRRSFCFSGVGIKKGSSLNLSEWEASPEPGISLSLVRVETEQDQDFGKLPLLYFATVSQPWVSPAHKDKQVFPISSLLFSSCYLGMLLPELSMLYFSLTEKRAQNNMSLVCL